MSSHHPHRSHHNSTPVQGDTSPFNELSPALPDQRGAKALPHEALRILRRHKWIILLVTLFVGGLVSIYAVLSETSYEAYALLMVEESGPGEAPLDISGIPDALQRGPRNMADHLILLRQSMPVAEQAARRLREAQDSISEPLSALIIPKRKAPTVTEIALRLQRDYVSVMRESVTRENDLKSNGLRITAVSTNPREAAFIANAYAEAYRQHARQSSGGRIGSSRTFLENQIAKRRSELRQLENEIEQYMSREGATALDEETERIVQQVANLEAGLDESYAEKRRSEAALRSVEQELEEIRPELAERVSSSVEEEIAQEQNKIADLEARLEQIYITNPELRSNPSQSKDVVELKSRIGELKERVGRLSEQYVSEMMAVGGTDPLSTDGASMTYISRLKRQASEERVAVSGAEARIQALEERLAQYRRRLQSIPRQSMELAQLRRAQEATEKQYESLREKLQEVRLADEAAVATVSIVRPAFVPESNAFLRTLLLIAAGLFLGLVLGVIAAVVRHNMDSRLYTPEDLRKRYFNALGVIPDMDRLQHAGHLSSTREGRARKGASGDGTALLAKAGASSSAVTSLENSYIPPLAADAYHRLRISIMFSRQDQAVRSVLVTSPEPEAGKSTTAFNLAVAAARAGQRTLLVDADLRKPQIHNLLDKTSGSPAPILTDLLNEPALPNATQLSTGLDNLYAITVREPLQDADAVLSSSRMRNLIHRLYQDFDLVIFDSPPTLAVADALLLADQCDVTLVVANAGHTEAEALEQAASELRSADAPFIGTVLNRFNPSESSGDSYKYRYQGYGYGHTGAHDDS